MTLMSGRSGITKRAGWRPPAHLHARRLPHLAFAGGIRAAHLHRPGHSRTGRPGGSAQRSPQARNKDAAKQTPDNLPLYRYRDLLSHLSTLDRQIINFSGQKIEKLTYPPLSRLARSACSDHLCPSGSRSQKPHPHPCAYPQISRQIDTDQGM